MEPAEGIGPWREKLGWAGDSGQRTRRGEAFRNLCSSGRDSWSLRNSLAATQLFSLGRGKSLRNAVEGGAEPWPILRWVPFLELRLRNGERQLQTLIYGLDYNRN